MTPFKLCGRFLLTAIRRFRGCSTFVHWSASPTSWPILPAVWGQTVGWGSHENCESRGIGDSHLWKGALSTSLSQLSHSCGTEIVKDWELCLGALLSWLKLPLIPCLQGQLIFLLVRKFVSQVCTVPLTQYWSSLCNSFLWDTVSNVLLKTRTATSVCIPASWDDRRLCIESC